MDQPKDSVHGLFMAPYGERLTTDHVIALQQYMLGLITFAIIVFSMSLAVMTFSFRHGNIIATLAAVCLIFLVLVFSITKVVQSNRILRKVEPRNRANSAFMFGTLILLSIIFIGLMISPRLLRIATK